MDAKIYTAPDDFPFLSICLRKRPRGSTVALSSGERLYPRASRYTDRARSSAFVPFEFLDSDGVYKGIAADVLEIVEQRTGLRFVLTGNLTWQEVTDKALEREIDLLPAVGKTTERERIFLFSEPYMTFQRVVVVKNTNQTIKDFADLFGRQVAVQANSSHHGYLQNYPQIDIRTYNTVEDALHAVNRGEEVAFVGNEATTSYLTGSLGMTELSFIPINTGESLQLHMAVRDDWPQLVSILNKALDSISEAEFAEIYQKWITIDRRIDFTFYITIAVGLGVFSLIVFSVSAFWITRLKREIVEKEEAQREMEEAMERAEQADKEKSRFMARMSHEIRTPLNGINGMTYLLGGTTLDPTQRRYLKTISQAAKNMLSIINDIIEYSRIEERRVPIEKIPFKLDEVVQHILSLENPVIHQKELQLHFEWDSNVPIHVKGDAKRLGQIITNLVHNAVKFAEKGSIGIRIFCTHLSEYQCRVMFEISDTGIGISKEAQDNLFKPFSQADASISRKYGGSGLGLSIVKSLIEMMDGKLTLSSELGKGSRFSFELPFDLDLEGVKESDKRLDALDLSSLDILVLAKDEQTRKAIEIALHRVGVSADYIGSPQLASQLMIDESAKELPMYRLLIMDATIDGDLQQLFAAIHKGQEKKSQVKILAFVSDGDDERIEEMRRLGVDILLPKPVLPSLVFDSILDFFSDTVLSSQDQIMPLQGISGEKRGTILVVEDNIVNRAIALEVLERFGYQVLIAENGKDGYELFVREHDRIDLILMDLHMDVMDGFEATRMIRTLDVRIPIFALTADVVGDIHERCSSAGFNHIIAKPYDPEELLRIIGQTIGDLSTELPSSKQEYHQRKKERGVFDFAKGKNRVDGNDNLFEKLVTLFMQEVSTGRPQVEDAFARKDWIRIAEFSHKTKGGAYTIGADRLGDVAKRMQTQAQQESTEASPLFEEFKLDLALLEVEIEKFFASSALKS